MNEQRSRRLEPGRQYLYSPSRKEITAVEPHILKMNADTSISSKGSGDWCYLTVAEPDLKTIDDLKTVELRKLAYKPGMSEKDLVEAVKGLPVEAVDAARSNARYAAIELLVPAAMRKAESDGPVPVASLNWKQLMTENAKGSTMRNAIDLSKPIPDERPAKAA